MDLPVLTTKDLPDPRVGYGVVGESESCDFAARPQLLSEPQFSQL